MADQNALAGNAAVGGDDAGDAAINEVTASQATDQATDSEETVLSDTGSNAEADDVATDLDEADSADESALDSSVDITGGQPELQEALQPVATTEAAQRKEVPGGRSYEIIYIVRAGNPELVEQTSTRVNEMIESNGGGVDNVRISETRRLAYPIQKQIEGIYIVVNARFSKDLTQELDRFFKLEEAILRHMTLREEV